MDEADLESEILVSILADISTSGVHNKKPVYPYLELLVEAPSTRFESDLTLFCRVTMAFLSGAHSVEPTENSSRLQL